MAVKDYLTDENGDLAFYQGDLKVGFSDEQHKDDIIVSEIGSWKEFPTLGVGISKYLNGPNFQEAKKYIKLHLETDSYKVKAIDINDNLEIKVDADRI